MPALALFLSFRMPNKSSALWPDALLLTALFLLLALLPPVSSWLEYRRDLIAQGEVWRLFTGHFVHLNLHHAVMNAVGAVLVAHLFAAEIKRQQWWALILAMPLFISLGLWLRQPDLQGYAGFSGLLHGLLYFGVVRLLASAPVLAGCLLLLLVGRQVWEQTDAYNPGYLQHVINGRVMPDAHLFGALAGLLAGGGSLWREGLAGRLGKGNPSGYSSPNGSTPDA